MKTLSKNIKFILSAFLIFLSCWIMDAQTCNANFTYSIGSNGSVSFTNLSTPSVSPSYTWNFGNGQNSNSVNPSYTFTANNTYDVSLSAYSPTPGCTSFTFAMITITNVVSTCSANFAYNLGANGVVSFTSTSLGTNTSTPYGWSFGNSTGTTGIGFAGMNALTTYTANGIYTVMLTIGSTLSPCYSSTTQTISVTTSTNNFPCNLNLGSPSLVSTNTSNVVGLILSPSGFSSTTTYTVNWGDGNTSNGNLSTLVYPNPLHTYTNAGFYNVTMNASNNTSVACTFSSPVGNVNMCGGTTFDLTLSYSLGTNGQVSLFSSGVGTTATTGYTWNVNGSQSNYQSNIANPTFTLPNGVYTPYFYAKNAGGCLIGAGANINSFTITTAPPCTLIPAFSYSLQSLTTQFINQTTSNFSNLSGSTFTWSFGDGTSNAITGSTNSINHAYAYNGTYSVSLTASNTACGAANTTSLVVITNTVNNPCTPNVSFIHYQSINSGVVSFYDASTNVFTVNPTYLWKFGDGITSSFVNPTHTYSLNGVYNVTLQITNSSSLNCNSSFVSPVTVTNACGGLSAGINYTVSGAQVYCSDASINTSSASSYLYQWDVGNNYQFNTNYTNTPSFSATFLNGIYNIALTISDASNAACQSYVNTTFTVSNSSNCNISAAFTSSAGANGIVGFTNASSGINASTAYIWHFGDGASATVANPIHTYTSSGTYTVSFWVIDQFYCSGLTYCKDSITSVLNVSITPCPTYTANFTHTLSSNGLVNFTDASLGTNSTTAYSWNFGDGWYSNTMNPNHTYANGGTHYVYHYLRSYGCPSDSVVYAINVTGIPCAANANFSVVPSNVPQYWYAVLAYPYNISNAQWNWGDGSSSNFLYASHQYSAAANYSICLSVTASCGSTATSCYTYNIYKGNQGSSNIISINVVQGQPELETAITMNTMAEVFELYPNPNHGDFILELPNLNGQNRRIEIQDILGKVIWFENINHTNAQLNIKLNSEDIKTGIYFIKVYNGESIRTKKLIIQQ